jgi:hypothetical protein
VTTVLPTRATIFGTLHLCIPERCNNTVFLCIFVLAALLKSKCSRKQVATTLPVSRLIITRYYVIEIAFFFYLTYFCFKSYSTLIITALSEAKGYPEVNYPCNSKCGREQLSAIKDIGWLDDEILNCFTTLCTAKNFATTHVVGLSTFFFFSRGPGSLGSHENIQKMLTRRLVKLQVDPTAFEGHLVFPINDNGTHWSTGWADLKSKQIRIFNSFNGQPTPSHVLNAVKSILARICGRECNVMTIKSQQQSNLSDCGVYVAYHIYLISCYSEFMKQKCDVAAASSPESCGDLGIELDIGIPKINPQTMRRYLAEAIFMKRATPFYLYHGEGFYSRASDDWSDHFYTSQFGDIALPYIASADVIIPGTTKPVLIPVYVHTL